MRLVFVCFFIILCYLLKAQEQRTGIKLLVKDKLTGLTFTDTLVITADDTLRKKLLSDPAGYLYIDLPPGKHSISASHIGYQTQIMYSINVSEQKTSYITLMLDAGREEKGKKRGVRLKMKK